LVWCETGTPDLDFAKRFAEGVQKVHPGKMLAYNCSPSFNWKKNLMGTEHSDEMTPEGFLSNNAGGILGGISTGQDIVVSIAIKPTSSIRLARQTIDIEGNAATIETHGRHDPCVGIRATPIAEAFLALVLIDHALRHRAQNAEVNERVGAIP